MSKKLLFIINPLAGKGAIRNHLLAITDIFQKADFQVSLHITQASGDASRAAREHCGDYDVVACSGGDGTLNEVIEGLMEHRNPPPIGYIPAGTTNDFASSLGIPKNPVKAAEAIVKGRACMVDIGVFGQRFFTYVAAFGAFTDVSYDTPQASKNKLGRLAYIMEGIKRVPNLKSYRVKMEHDGETIEDDFIYGMVTNSHSIGGFKGLSGKHVKMDDGLFEASMIKMPRNTLEIQSILHSLLMREPNPDYIYFFRTGEVTLSSQEEIPWTVDGENGGLASKIAIRCQKQAVAFLLDAQ